MSRIDARLSEAVAYGFEGGPEWSTIIVDLDNGGELRNGQWLYPRHRYSAQFMNISESARDEIISAFHVCRGRLFSFRFKDWNDYQANNEALSPSFASQTPVQLQKTYTFGSSSTVRKIRAIVSAVVRDKDNAVVSGSLDSETGLFTPLANWDSGQAPYTWSGEFDVWVRFDADYNPFAINSWKAHTSDLDLIEDKF